MMTLLRVERCKHLFKTFLLTMVLAIVFTPRLHAQAIIEHSKFLSTGASATTSAQKLIVEGPHVYVLALTSTNTMPITIGTVPPNSATKSILLKLDTAGRVIWARYMPWGGVTSVTSYRKMELNNGTLYLLGSTSATDVPVTNGSTAGGGGSDILFAKVDAGSGSLLHNGYLGGSSVENTGLALAVENGIPYITYTTQSANIFTTTGPAFTTGFDHIVQKLGSAGNILYSTYTGSVATVAATTDSVSLAVENGNAYLGFTVSSTNNFTTTDGSTVQGSHDHGILKLDASGNKSFATVIGGTGAETRTTLLVNSGNMFLAGLSTSTNFPVTNGSVKAATPFDLLSPG